MSVFIKKKSYKCVKTMCKLTVNLCTFHPQRFSIWFVSLQRCSSSVSVLTSVISLHTVISHISCSSGVCGRRPVNFPHAVLIGPYPTSFPNSFTKKWWLSFYLPQNGASFCSPHPQMISVQEGSSNWFSNRKR